jgi:DNA-binding transcriptional MerR regulator
MSNVAQTEDELLSVGGAARLLGICESRVRQLAATGVLQAARTSSGWRVLRRRDVERLQRERVARRVTAREPPSEGEQPT